MKNNVFINWWWGKGGNSLKSESIKDDDYIQSEKDFTDGKAGLVDGAVWVIQLPVVVLKVFSNEKLITTYLSLFLQ